MCSCMVLTSTPITGLLLTSWLRSVLTLTHLYCVVLTLYSNQWLSVNSHLSYDVNSKPQDFQIQLKRLSWVYTVLPVLVPLIILTVDSLNTYTGTIRELYHCLQSGVVIIALHLRLLIKQIGRWVVTVTWTKCCSNSLKGILTLVVSYKVHNELQLL